MRGGEVLALRDNGKALPFPGQDRRGSINDLLLDQACDYVTTIRGFAQLSLQKREQRYVTDVVGEADKLQRIVGWAHCLSRAPATERLEVGHTLRQVAESFADVADVRATCTEGVCLSVGDMELRTAVECMVQNVQEACSGGRILLEAGQDGREVRISARVEAENIADYENWPRGAALAVLCAVLERRGGRVHIHRATKAASIDTFWPLV